LGEVARRKNHRLQIPTPPLGTADAQLQAEQPAMPSHQEWNGWIWSLLARNSKKTLFFRDESVFYALHLGLKAGQDWFGWAAQLVEQEIKNPACHFREPQLC